MSFNRPRSNAKRCKEPMSSFKPMFRRSSSIASSEFPRHVEYKLVKCKYCKRQFFAGRVELHEEICRNIYDKPQRPVYDSSKSRVSGTCAEGYPQQGLVEKLPINRRWKSNNEEFQFKLTLAKKAVRDANMAAEIALIRPPPVTEYVQCGICGRRFSETAAARHIPNCRNYVRAKPAVSKQK